MERQPPGTVLGLGRKACGPSVPGVVIRALSPASCGTENKPIISRCGYRLLKGAAIEPLKNFSSSENLGGFKHRTR